MKWRFEVQTFYLDFYFKPVSLTAFHKMIKFESLKQQQVISKDNFL